MICIVTSLSVTFVMYFNGRNQDILFILFIYYQEIHPYPRQEVLQLSPLAFEFSVWLDHNGVINWVSLGVFGEICSSFGAVWNNLFVSSMPLGNGRFTGGNVSSSSFDAGICILLADLSVRWVDCRRLVLNYVTLRCSEHCKQQPSFVFPDGPGTNTIARPVRVNVFAKTKTK